MRKWIPFLESVQTYDRKKCRLDLIAGLTVASIALPQAMAYAVIAGVEPEYGIYALIVGSIIGALFGSSRHLHTGPVNASSIVIAAAMMPHLQSDDYTGMILFLALMSGIFKLAAGFLKIGNLTQFISRSVLVGFVSGAALLIIVNQIPNLLGLSRSTGTTFITSLLSIFQKLSGLDPATLTIGLGTILLVLILNRLSPKSATGVSYIPSYFLGLITAAAVVAIFSLTNKGIVVVGEIPATLPPVSMPALDTNTLNVLGPAALALALISISEAIGSAKSIAALAGDKIRPNQELIGQGLANIGVAFLSGMPVSGSFTRTALNFRAGAQTRFAAVFSGVFLMAMVAVFSPLAQYIPVAALAGIIMVIAKDMMNWKHIRLTLKTTKSDASVMIATFIATLLFRLDTAIYIGVGLSLVLFLRKAMYPRLIELEYDEGDGFQELSRAAKRKIPEISIIHLEGDLFFGAAEFMEEEIGKIARRPGLKVLILRIKSSFALDATTIMALMQFIETMKASGKLLIISGVTGDVERIFRDTGIDKAVGEENIFFSDTAVLKSTKHALQRALDYVNATGKEPYRLRLFYDRPEKAKR